MLVEANSGVASSCYVDPVSGAASCPTVFPAALAMAASFNRTSWRLKGQIVSDEIRAFNNLRVPRIYGPLGLVNLYAFGPNINLLVDCRDGRNGELASEDPTLSGLYTVEYVQGMQVGEDPRYLKVAAHLKHYAMYQSETNRMAYEGNATTFDQWDSYLPPYQLGFMQGGAVGVMCSYASVNGVPSCASDYLLNQVVRGYWGAPDTLVMSDCGAVENQANANHYAVNISDASAKSMKAGTDLCDGTAYVVDGGLASALATGELAESDLDTALGRSLAKRMALGHFDPLEGQIYTTYGREKINTPTAQRAAYEAAAQGMVLLKNTPPAAPGSGKMGGLPWDLYSPALTSLAVVGPHANSQRELLGDFYGDAYCAGVTTSSNRSSWCVPTIGASFISLLATPRPDVAISVAAGVGVVSNDTSRIPAALAAVSAADAVVMALGYDNAHLEHEGADHPNNTLPGLQAQFAQQVLTAAAARGAPVVVVLVNAGQIALPQFLLDGAAAIIEAFYPSFGAPAIAAGIMGQENRWGRLPYTIYPADYINQIDLSNLNVSAPPGRTYRYYPAASVPMNWTFGYGLSYSTFALSCSGGPGSVQAGSNFTVVVSCTDTNSAASPPIDATDDVILAFHRAGADVRASIGTAHPVPSSSLRDFTRLGPLAPGASVPFAFYFSPLSLALTNHNGASVLYPGTHYIDVSPRPPAAPVSITVTVTGSAPVVLAAPPLPPNPYPPQRV